MTKFTNKIVASIAAAAMTSQAGAALAAASGTGTNFTTVSTNIVDSAKGLPSLISTTAYVGGIGLGVAGVFKLKQHVDNPGQTPMKDGLVRLGAGGGLLALPFVTDAMQGTIGSGGGSATDDLKGNINKFDITP